MNESNKTSMRSFTPKIIENETTEVIGKSDSKPTVQRYHFKKRMSPGFLSMSDLDKMNAGKKPVVPTLSMESLRNILKNSDVSYLDNGEICRHDIGGSAPDLKKIFITEFIWEMDVFTSHWNLLLSFFLFVVLLWFMCIFWHVFFVYITCTWLLYNNYIYFYIVVII